MVLIDFPSFPVIETERLFLRQITTDDVNDIFAFRSNKTAMQYISRPLAATKEDALQLIKLMSDFYATGKGISWGICLKSINKVVGTIGFVHIDKNNFRAEIGYMLHPSLQKQGIMQEAMQPIIDLGFNVMQLHSIEANVHPENIASKIFYLK